MPERIHVEFEFSIRQMQILNQYTQDNKLDNVVYSIGKILGMALDNMGKEQTEKRIEIEKSAPRKPDKTDEIIRLLSGTHPDCIEKLNNKECNLNKCNNTLYCPIRPHPKPSFSDAFDLAKTDDLTWVKERMKYLNEKYRGKYDIKQENNVPKS